MECGGGWPTTNERPTPLLLPTPPWEREVLHEAERVLGVSVCVDRDEAISSEKRRGRSGVSGSSQVADSGESTCGRVEGWG